MRVLPSSRPFRTIRVLCLALFPMGAGAQIGYQRTKSVDPSGNAGFTTIAEAIEDIGVSPSERWTVLVYPGEYAEAVVLASTATNIDIVGVDRDSVVIAPTGTDDAVTILGTGVRNNAVRNLTIRTSSTSAGHGRGVVISKSGTGDDPSAVTLDNLAIETTGEASHAVMVSGGAADVVMNRLTILTHGKSANMCECADVNGLTVRDGDMRSCDGRFRVGNNTEMSRTLVMTDATYGTATPVSDDTEAVIATGKSGLVVDTCRFYGRFYGLYLKDSSATERVTNATVRNSELRGAQIGLGIDAGDGILVENCLVVAESSRGYLATVPVTPYSGALVAGKFGTTLSEPGSIRFVNCDIRGTCSPAESSKATDAYGVLVRGAPPPATGPIRLINCAISSEVGGEANGKASHGVAVLNYASGDTRDLSNALAVFGGSIFSKNKERETNTFDVFNPNVDQERIRVTGVTLSKWRGSIAAAERPRVIVQRFADVPAPSTNVILDSSALTNQEVVLSDGFNQPLAYRALSVTGTSGTNQTVIVLGKDLGNSDIVEKFTLNGTTTVIGKRAFASISKIILPAGSSGQAVSIGTTSILGLQAPLAIKDNFLYVATKQGSPAVFSGLVAPNLADIDATYWTLNVGSFSTTTSFEITLIASE